MFSIWCKVALNQEEIKIIFIYKYNWEEINYPSEKGYWKNSEKHNLTVALNILYATNEKIYSAYVSKQNSL